jgi:N6-adenosine-specific RNA methylase IME4
MRTEECREKIDAAALACNLDPKTVDKVKQANGVSDRLEESFPQICGMATDAVLELGKKRNKENLPKIIPILKERMDAGERPTTKEIVKLFQELQPEAPPIDGKYRVIYADPPWEYNNSGFEMSAANQYPTMSIEALIDMKIQNIAEDNAILFMWATNPLLEDAIRLMKAWEFEYKTNMVWIKDRHTAGFYVFGQHELLLIGVKGSMLPSGNKPKSIITGANDVHSKKPESVYATIEGMYPGSTYIELFARNKHPGWVSWGNQA